MEAPTTLRLVVELVYDADCPNVDKARAVLTRALQEAGMPAVWTEWCTEDPNCPEGRKGRGSPTILVNGDDVSPGPRPWSPAPPEERGPMCRVYRDGEEMLGAPPLPLVLGAILDVLEPEAG